LKQALQGATTFNPACSAMARFRVQSVWASSSSMAE
jgi:hypothetical protein